MATPPPVCSLSVAVGVIDRASMGADRPPHGLDARTETTGNSGFISGSQPIDRVR
ncbi:hypothetical protein HKK80_09185 [Halonotius sp. F2-221B]|uniref:hypothetical protein n=1 Tax=Halonotius sp. F2-221B TaxID=2731620 RepID=UPI00398AC3D2